MLIELSRIQRNSKLLTLGTSPENKKYTEYFDYYKGDHFVRSNYMINNSDYGRVSHYNVYTRSGIPVFDDNIKDNKVIVQSNWCRVIVDTIADYARGVNEDIVITSDVKQDEIQKVWKDNDINILTREIAEEAGKMGKTYLRLRRRKKDANFEIFNIDPGGIFKITNPITGDIDGIIYFFGMSADNARRLYPSIAIKDSTQDVYYAEEWTNDKLYQFVDGVQVNPTNDYNIVQDGNPYGFLPFYEIKADNDGESDIADVISLNDELNMTLTFNHETIKYHAFPIYSPSGSFTGQNLIPAEALKKVEISPRTILNFPAQRISGEGVPDSVIKYIEQLKQEISINAGVPLKLLTAEIDGKLSGVALQRLMSGIIKKAEMRRNYIEEAYEKISQDIIILLGGGEADVDVNFPDIIKIDTNERLDEALKKESIGISKETIFEELGYDYQEEEKQRQVEFDNSLEKKIRDEMTALNPNDKNGIQPTPPQFKAKGTLPSGENGK